MERLTNVNIKVKAQCLLVQVQSSFGNSFLCGKHDFKNEVTNECFESFQHQGQ